MDIVILDGYTANPGDLNWNEFTDIGNTIVYDRTEPKDIIKRAAETEILLTNKTEITGEIMSAMPRLKYIGLLSTGTNVVDLEAARRKGIIVTNIPAYSTASVAQLVFALLLELCTKTSIHDRAVHEGEWVSSKDFCFTKSPLIELDSKIMGIVGCGSIGRRVAAIASSMGMKVVAYSRTRKEENGIEGFKWLELPELMAQSDVISLHCPLTPETRHLINKDTISLMKKTAYLINTSRGPVIDEAAVADALNSGRIAGAGFDVLSTEPPKPDNPLLTAKNCVITPHIGWATIEARSRLIKIAAENVRSFLAGKPINVVN